MHSLHSSRLLTPHYSTLLNLRPLGSRSEQTQVYWQIQAPFFAASFLMGSASVADTWLFEASQMETDDHNYHRTSSRPSKV